MPGKKPLNPRPMTRAPLQSCRADDVSVTAAQGAPRIWRGPEYHFVPLAAQLQQEKVDSAPNRDQWLPRKPLPRPQGAGRGTR